MNVPRLVGAVISANMATLRECQEFYSVEDLYDIYEVVAIDSENTRRVNRASNKE